MRLSDSVSVALLVVGTIILFVIVSCGFVALSAGVLYFAWNAVVPSAFDGPNITFIEAFALMLLLSLLRGIVSFKTESKD